MRSLLASIFVGSAAAAAINMDSIFARLPRANATSNLAPLGTYRNCGSSSDTAKNLVISIVPDAPKAGQSVTTIFQYDLSKEVTSGTASYGFTFNGIPFSPELHDLCEEQSGGCCPDPCPLAAVYHENKSISDFPSGVSGKIVTTIKWTDQDDAQILCVEWTVKV